MAYTTLPADHLKVACERAASLRNKVEDKANLRLLLGILHLASAALSVNANATLTVTSEEFLLLAESW